MTRPWSAQQVEWLQAMGFEVMTRAPAAVPAARPAAPARADAGPMADVAGLPAGLRRAARGLDLAALVAVHGVPRDPAARRAFWPALRALRRTTAVR